MNAKVNRVTIEIVQDDIYSLPVEGLVHATDSNLTVGEKLTRLAGPRIQSECTELGWCEVGSAVVTSSGRLPVKRIIHAVGPRWGEGSERGKLTNVIWNVLTLAEDHELASLAMPAISTGKLGYPLENCAITMLSQIIDFTFERVKHLKSITVCVDNEIALEAFEQEFQRQLDELKETGDAKIGKVRA